MVGIYLFADPDDPSHTTFTWKELGMFGLCVDQMRLNELTENALFHYSKRISTNSKEYFAYRRQDGSGGGGLTKLRFPW